MHGLPDLASARAAWSYTHGLASLVTHGVAAAPPGATEERFLEGTLQRAQKRKSP